MGIRKVCGKNSIPLLNIYITDPYLNSSLLCSSSERVSSRSLSTSFSSYSAAIRDLSSTSRLRSSSFSSSRRNLSRSSSSFNWNYKKFKIVNFKKIEFLLPPVLVKWLRYEMLYSVVTRVQSGSLHVQSFVTRLYIPQNLAASDYRTVPTCGRSCYRTVSNYGGNMARTVLNYGGNLTGSGSNSHLRLDLCMTEIFKIQIINDEKVT